MSAQIITNSDPDRLSSGAATRATPREVIHPGFLCAENTDPDSKHDMKLLQVEGALDPGCLRQMSPVFTQEH